MNYIDLMKSLLNSKKINVGGGAGAVILAVPTLMAKIGMSGNPVIIQSLLGALALGYVVVQGIIDHGVRTARVKAIQETVAAAVSSGFTPDNCILFAKQMDTLLEAVENPTPDATAGLSEAAVAAINNLVSRVSTVAKPASPLVAVEATTPIAAALLPASSNPA